MKHRQELYTNIHSMLILQLIFKILKNLFSVLYYQEAIQDSNKLWPLGSSFIFVRLWAGTVVVSINNTDSKIKH